MDELRAQFREGLLARIRALEAAQRALDDSRDDAVATIRRVAHSLHGAGGTYGFPEVSEAAALVEHSPEEDLPDRLEALLCVLRVISHTSDLGERAVILLVEDDASTVSLFSRALEGPGRELVVARDRQVAEQVIETRNVSLVLLDLMLPGFDGRDFLTWLRDRHATKNTPVLVISAKESTFVRAECFALGADEYFTKPLDFDELAIAASSRLQRFAEQTRESRRDSLTQLSNRAAAGETFTRASAVLRREGSALTVAMIDLGRFKAVNDTYGHATGDQVLRRTAETLIETLRASDFVARWGGEEFLVLLPNTDSAGARQALQNVAARLKEVPVAEENGEKIFITFSAGTADVRETDSLDDVVARADRLLYMGKAAGGDKVLAESETKAPPRRTIVVAEDDELLAAMMKRLLVAEGFDVIICADGHEALAVAKSTRPSLMILDVDMPGLSGMDVLGQLKSSGFHKRIPIMMLTARATDDDIVGAFDLGADDYVTKPFSPAELRARVRRHVGTRKGATVH